MTEYPPSGALFTNQRKQKESQPDYTGTLELSDEVVNDLVEQISRGVAKPKLSLAGWKKVAQKSGATFLSCLLYTSPSPRDGLLSRMPSSA